MLGIDELLIEMKNKEGSDLHISVNQYPFFRSKKDGELHILFEKKIERDDFELILQQLLKSESAFLKLLEKEEIDITYRGIAGRYRVNIGLAMSEPFAVLRELKSDIPFPDKLNIPKDFVNIIEKTNYGLVLIGGTTGSGKSTTMASVVNYLLEKRAEKVITIEEPVEYILGTNNCKGYVIQREVGKDTLSFANALRSAVRQDPDYILVGEIRDIETAKNCIIASEMGHIVFATIHVKDTISAIDRFCGVFPAEEQLFIRRRFVDNLIAVQVQVLCPAKDKKSRLLVTELLVVDDEVRENLFEKNYKKVKEFLMNNKKGWTLNNSLEKFYKQGLIDKETFDLYRM